MKRLLVTTLLALCLISNTLHAGEKLDQIKQLMDDAASGKNMNVTYIVSGDSTRDSTTAGQEYTYAKMLKQINIKYVHNARSGLRAYQWVRNTVTDSCLNKAIASSAGAGENTIMEFSLGINDKNAYSREDTKKNLKESIQKYLAAKPKAHVFLVVPVTHQTSFQKEWLVLYTELSKELNLPLVNKERVLYKAFYDPDNRFFYDNTHPNYFGALRLTRYILETISGPIAKNKFKWETDFFTGSKNEDSSKNLAANVKLIKKSWYWPHNKSAGMKGGKPYDHPVINRLEPIKVNENSLIKITGVTVFRVGLIDSAGKLQYSFDNTMWKKHNLQYIYVPRGITELRISLKQPKDPNTTEKPVITYLNTGALAALTANDIYYEGK